MINVGLERCTGRAVENNPFWHLSFQDRSGLSTLVTSTWIGHGHVRRECTLAIGATQRVRFDPTQCTCTHNMSNRLIRGRCRRFFMVRAPLPIICHSLKEYIWYLIFLNSFFYLLFVDVPDAPRFLKAEMVFNGDILLNWKPPIYSGGSCITQYIIEMLLQSSSRDWTCWACTRLENPNNTLK